MKLSAKVTKQGAPVVSSVAVLYKGPGVIVVQAYMHSKYCVSGYTMGTSLEIRAIDASLKLMPGKCIKDETVLSIEGFPDPINWRILCAESTGRYDISAVLVHAPSADPMGTIPLSQADTSVTDFLKSLENPCEKVPTHP